MISHSDAAHATVGAPGPGELLIELLSEEIPARMQRRAIADLTALIRDRLAAAEIPASDMRSYVTPRRLAVVAVGIPATQPDRIEERRGPRVGAPPPAVAGFLRSAGVGSVEECEIRDTGRGEFYFAVIRRSGRPAAEVLPELIKAAIIELPWPKSMRWPGSPVRWVRPLTSVICLYDGDILPLALDGIPVGRITSGHRVLASGEICVGNAIEYVEKLEQAHVILDQDCRKELIRTGLDRCAAQLGVAAKPDPGLLDEVTGLAEFPVVLAGAIDPDFMTLPPEVLQTAMRTHQKYFSCVHPDGRPAPHFLFVANNRAADGGKAIVAGNERVLRARLADARFFWDQDRKIRLEDRVEALKDRVYHAKLGSMYDKVERTEQLVGFLSKNASFRDYSFVTPAQAGVQSQRPDPAALDSRVRGNDEGELNRSARRAAHLAKADLSTGMVGEFPELQGVMGRYYALHDGEPREVADAIADHYKPLGPSDECPVLPVSVLVALADKIDALVGFFGINEKPTGSRDPFAQRRAALGVIRLILENNLRVSLAGLFRKCFQGWCAQLVAKDFDGVGSFGTLEPTDELLEFVADRLKVHLREAGVRHDLIAAVFSNPRAPGSLSPSETTTSVLGTLERAGILEDDLVRLLARVEALAKFLATEDGADLLTAYRRASNIVAIEERRDSRPYNDPVNPARFQQAEEAALWQRLSALNAMLDSFLVEEHFDRAMARLAALRQPVDDFFDKVTVNTDVPELRENRLRILSRIRATMNQVADFSQIEG